MVIVMSNGDDVDEDCYTRNCGGGEWKAERSYSNLSCGDCVSMSRRETDLKGKKRGSGMYFKPAH